MGEEEEKANHPAGFKPMISRSAFWRCNPALAEVFLWSQDSNPGPLDHTKSAMPHGTQLKSLTSIQLESFQNHAIVWSSLQ